MKAAVYSWDHQPINLSSLSPQTRNLLSWLLSAKRPHEPSRMSTFRPTTDLLFLVWRPHNGFRFLPGNLVGFQRSDLRWRRKGFLYRSFPVSGLQDYRKGSAVVRIYENGTIVVQTSKSREEEAFRLLKSILKLLGVEMSQGTVSVVSRELAVMNFPDHVYQELYRFLRSHASKTWGSKRNFFGLFRELGVIIHIYKSRAGNRFEKRVNVARVRFRVR